MSILDFVVSLGIAYFLASLAADDWNHKVSTTNTFPHFKASEACAHTSVLTTDDCIANGRRSLPNDILDHSRKAIWRYMSEVWWRSREAYTAQYGLIYPKGRKIAFHCHCQWLDNLDCKLLFRTGSCRPLPNTILGVWEVYLHWSIQHDSCSEHCGAVFYISPVRWRRLARSNFWNLGLTITGMPISSRISRHDTSCRIRDIISHEWRYMSDSRKWS